MKEILAAALLALSAPAWAENAHPRPVVTEIMAETPPASRAFAGVIAPRTEAQLAFQTLGTMIARDVSVGDHVRRGAIVARLNPDDLESSVRAAEAAAEAAAVQLRTAEATAARTRALRERGVAAQAQLEQAERALAAGRAAEQQAQSQLARARDAEGFAAIAAPFDGVVTAVLKEVGMVVSAGDPVLVLASDDAREAVIDLPETLLSGLAPGAAFIVTPERDRDLAIPARVERIEPMADAATRTRRVHLALDGTVTLRLGALVRAHRAGSGAAMLTLPVEALREPANGAASVWVVTRALADPGAGDIAADGGTAAGTAPGIGTVAARPVAIGPDWMGRVEVTSGLTAGEEVVVRGVNSLNEGQAVGRAVAP